MVNKRKRLFSEGLSVLQGRSDKSVGFSHLQQRNVKDIVSFTVQLLPTLCTHLENCHNYFQVHTHTEDRWTVCLLFR